MAELIPLEEARAIVLAHTSPLAAETVDIVEASGRVAAADITADIDNSPFAHAAMDGFAVRAEQLACASADSPVELDVVAEVAAGSVFDGELDDTQCVRIMTGAPLPACADSVVKYEVVDVVEGDGKTGSRVAFRAPAAPGANVRSAGEEAHAGDVIVTAGEVINSAGVGFLAGCGATRVLTYRRPRVAIIATGSELVAPEAVPPRGKIRNSNSASLAACVASVGAVPSVLGIVEDDYDVLAEAVRSAAASYDCVLTTGGAAHGDYDFIERVVSALGQTYVTAINMRPGKAETYGHVDGTAVFGLPGNPAAAYMGFQMLVRPALRKMQGYSHFELARVQATLACDVTAKKDARMTLMRAVIEKRDGSYVVCPLKKQSSGLFGPLQRSNALIRLERGDVGHAAGERVECVLLDVSEDSAL